MNSKLTILIPIAILVAVDQSHGARFLGGFQVNLPHTFSAGAPARASEVNENFGALGSAMELRAADVDARLDGLPSFENVLSVSPSGAEFSSVAAALASISNASSQNRFVVEVGPGVYAESSVCRVPSFVTLRGAGRSATVITAARSSSAHGETSSTMVLLDEGRVERLTVENTGTGTLATAISGTSLSSSTRINDVLAQSNGAGGSEHYALRIEESDAVIEASQMTASGASSVNAAFASVDTGGAFAAPRLVRCVLEAQGGALEVGARLTLTSAVLEDCRIDADDIAVETMVDGQTDVLGGRLTTQGQSSIFTASGTASLRCMGVLFEGGNALGSATQFRYVHCARADFNSVVNGFGSTIQ